MNQKNKKEESQSTNRINDFLYVPALATIKSNSSDLSSTYKLSEKHNNTKDSRTNIVDDFFNNNDLDLDSLLSSEDISIDEELFSIINSNEDEYISKDELSDYIVTLKDSLKSEDISISEFKESVEDFVNEKQNITQNVEELSVTTTEDGNEVTIEGDYSTLDNSILITLDDVTSSDDEITVNLVQEDESNQTIDDITIDGIENVTLNVVEDVDNSSDDVVSINNLVMDDTETLTILSEESISINNIKSESLSTIDLTQATAGFEINNVESSNIVTFKIGTILDGTGEFNYDSNNDNILDSSFSAVGLSTGIEDIIDFTSNSLDNNLLIKNAELGISENSDTINFSSLGIDTVDDLIFTDINSSQENKYDYSGLEITSEYFDGSVTLVGTTTTDVDYSNFIFSV